MMLYFLGFNQIRVMLCLCLVIRSMSKEACLAGVLLCTVTLTRLNNTIALAYLTAVVDPFACASLAYLQVVHSGSCVNQN